MAIRLRIVDGTMVALCAARSVEKPDDIYLDDEAHGALSYKFAADFDAMYECCIPLADKRLAFLTAQEEDDNPNRDDWDKVFSDNS